MDRALRELIEQESGAGPSSVPNDVDMPEDVALLAGWEVQQHRPPAVLCIRAVDFREPLGRRRARFWLTSFDESGDLIALGWRDGLRIVSEVQDLVGPVDRVVEPTVSVQEEGDYYRALSGQKGTMHFAAGVSRVWVEQYVSQPDLDDDLGADDEIASSFKKFVAHPDKKSVSPNQIPWSKVSSISFTQPGRYSTAVLKVHVVDESIGHIKPNQDPNALLGNVGKQADDPRLFAEQLPMRLAVRTEGAAQIVPTPTGSQRKTVRDAGSQIGVKFGARRELRKLHKHLMPGEQVRYVAGGQVSRRRGIIALTDHRFLVLFQGMTRNSIEDLPLDRITSIRVQSGLLLGTLTVVASNTQMVVSEISKVDMKRLSVALRLRISTGALPPLPAPSLSAVDDDTEQDASPVNGSTSDGRTKLLEQLEHLGRLKDAGVLGADEFEDAKAKLMNDF